jgi:hypothetical protein
MTLCHNTARRASMTHLTRLMPCLSLATILSGKHDMTRGLNVSCHNPFKKAWARAVTA